MLKTLILEKLKLCLMELGEIRYLINQSQNQSEEILEPSENPQGQHYMVAKAYANAPSCANVNANARTHHSNSTPDHSLFFENMINDLEVISQNPFFSMFSKCCDEVYKKKHPPLKPITYFLGCIPKSSGILSISFWCIPKKTHFVPKNPPFWRKMYQKTLEMYQTTPPGCVHFGSLAGCVLVHFGGFFVHFGLFSVTFWVFFSWYRTGGGSVQSFFFGTHDIGFHHEEGYFHWKTMPICNSSCQIVNSKY